LRIIEDEEESDSIKDSLVIGWGSAIAAALSGGLWSSKFLLMEGRDSATLFGAFWPLGLGILFLVIAFRMGLTIISKRRFYPGLFLVLMSILLPVFGALWPLALRVLHLISEQ